MITANQIHYITHNDIDKDKWNTCIDAAPNGLIYAYAWYLDTIAKHWDALVLNDYEAVMPLTWNKKWGIRYLYQPTITQQLGVFSCLEIDASLVQLFLAKACDHFRYAEIFLNYKCECPGLRKHANYILPLDSSYDKIYTGYKSGLVKNLKRSARLSLNYIKDFDLKTLLDLNIQTYADRIPHVKKTDWKRFEDLCFLAESKGYVITRAVCNDSNQLLAVALLFKMKNRLYLLESVTLTAGRQLKANHFLMTKLIEEFSNTNNILDFEGSDIPGIAYHYQTFGSTYQPYFFFYHNNLPWWIKWLKS